PHGELTAMTDARAGDLHGAAVQLRQGLHQRQADAEPARRSLQSRVHLREHVEDAWKVIGGDADASVADTDYHVWRENAGRVSGAMLSGFVRARHREPDATAAVGKLAV